jgi:hypothetical protein
MSGSSTRLSTPKQILVFISVLGFVASTIWHVLTLFGRELPNSLSMLLFLGIFVVWLPAVITPLPLNDRIAENRRNTWKVVMEGAPTWMALVCLYVGIYASINFFLATGNITGSVSSTDEHFQRVGSAIAMVFYSTASAIFVAARARDDAVRCPEGHFVFSGQDRCSICGQVPQSQRETFLKHGA